MPAARPLTPYELERGKPLPDLRHACVQTNLAYELYLRLGQRLRLLLELTLATEPSTTPDLAVCPRFALDYAHRPARYAQPPLCCIQIQSPPQSLADMLDKMRLYFAFGVRSCWVIQPAVRGVFVFDQPGHYAFFHGDDTLRDAALNLELPLAPVFA